MTYDECIVWLNRYRDARRVEPRLRERLREENRRAEFARAFCSPDMAGIDGALLSINTRREKLAAQLTDGETARVEIESAIAQLEDALEREVLQMRYIDGRTNRQIAARMRITERYVRKLHRRAIFKIIKLVPPSSAPVC
jgi:RNA polymerase sigma factor (sigma-70 family)